MPAGRRRPAERPRGAMAAAEAGAAARYQWGGAGRNARKEDRLMSRDDAGVRKERSDDAPAGPHELIDTFYFIEA